MKLPTAIPARSRRGDEAEGCLRTRPSGAEAAFRLLTSAATGAVGVAPASWSAVAERSGDTAFGAARRPRSLDTCPAAESGVAQAYFHLVPR